MRGSEPRPRPKSWKSGNGFFADSLIATAELFYPDARKCKHSEKNEEIFRNLQTF